MNKYDHKYDATVSSLKYPVKGTDSYTGRRTLSFDGTQYLACPMDWNGTASLDNLQVFIVFKYRDVSGSGVRGALFGNDNGDWDRFVSLRDNTVIVSGASKTTGPFIISSFPSDANPMQTKSFWVLSMIQTLPLCHTCGLLLSVQTRALLSSKDSAFVCPNIY